MTPKKRIVTDMCTYISPGEFECTLADLRIKINDLIDDYGPTARLDWNRYFQYDYDPEPSPRFEILRNREETDEEYTSRVEKENQQTQLRETQERAEFERLNKKFGCK